MFAQSALNNYDYLWNCKPKEEPDIAVMKSELAIQLRFYDLIRLRKGEKLRLVEFVAIGLTSDWLMMLIHLVAIKQPKSISYDYSTIDDEFISYNP